jgi:hypothetical protein
MVDFLNYTQVPTTKKEDINTDRTKWLGDKIVSFDEGKYITLYIGHFAETTTDDQGAEVRTTYAFPIRIAKPLTRDAAINAAEMQAYQLTTPMEVASFAASMARKFRLNPDDEEVKQHDEFIEWVKSELTNIRV